MIRGIEGANMFWDDKDREHFLSRVGEIGKATEKLWGRSKRESWKPGSGLKIDTTKSRR
jgi:hypothetical protein